MVRGIVGGDTDYSHQSLADIITDLEAEKINAEAFRDRIKANIKKAEAHTYWQSTVPSDFTNIVAYALRFYDTTIKELAEVSEEAKASVRDHHVNRLSKIAQVASEINVEIGRIWARDYRNKEYGNPDFAIVERIYGDTRDMAVNLLDIDNMTHRLRDYVGKESIKKKNPWISGSFYLFAAVVLLVVVATITKLVHWAFVPIVLIGGIVLVITVGLLQLRNDDMITDKSFSSLLKRLISQLPLLGRTGEPQQDD